MNKVERNKLVCAMEYIARQINDENVFEGWLAEGVADGDMTADCEDYYSDDEHFADLMDAFLWCMHKAYKSGGLYCDVVCRHTFS